VKKQKPKAYDDTNDSDHGEADTEFDKYMATFEKYLDDSYQQKKYDKKQRSLNTKRRLEDYEERKRLKRKNWYDEYMGEDFLFD
jgi:hypothetical protein